jgi:hypothetical protein
VCHLVSLSMFMPMHRVLVLVLLQVHLLQYCPAAPARRPRGGRLVPAVAPAQSAVEVVHRHINETRWTRPDDLCIIPAILSNLMTDPTTQTGPLHSGGTEHESHAHQHDDEWTGEKYWSWPGV